MYWTFILLALCGAFYRVATVGDDAAWWAVIGVLAIAFLVDLNREYRDWREAQKTAFRDPEGEYDPETDHEHI